MNKLFSKLCNMIHYPRFTRDLDKPLTRRDFNEYMEPDAKVHAFIALLLAVVGFLILMGSIVGIIDHL